jgi:hypothetical protein
VVWDRLTDFARWPEWFLGIRRLEVSPPRGGPDAERKLTLVYGGTHTERITHWEPPKAFYLEVRDPPFFARPWRVAVHLEPSARSTRLSWEMRYQMRLGAVGDAIDLLAVAPVLRLILHLSLRRLRSITASSPAAESPSPTSR